MRVTKSGVAALAIGLSFAAYYVIDYTRDGKLLQSLAMARQDLADISRIAMNTIGAAGEKEKSHQLELAEQRAKLDERATELADAQNDIQRTKATHAATDALYAANLETQLLKVTSLERDLAEVRLSNSEFRKAAEQVPQKQADLLFKRDAAEAAVKQASEALEHERRNAASGAARAADELARTQREYESRKVETAATIEQQRVHIEALQHDIAAAAEFASEAEARSMAASDANVNLLTAKEAAEAAEKQAGEALDRERERAIALASDLETARREQALAQEELARVSAATKEALEQESAKAASLRLQLASARKDMQALTRRLNRYAANASQRGSIANAAKEELPITITLPSALRPTRPAADLVVKSPIDR